MARSLFVLESERFQAFPSCRALVYITGLLPCRINQAFYHLFPYVVLGFLGHLVLSAPGLLLKGYMRREKKY